MDELANKNILITGASRGIGFDLAELLDQKGCNLLLHAGSDLGIQRLKEVFGGSDRHCFWQADFSKPDMLAVTLQETLQFFGPLSGYVNCVGLRVRRPLNLLNVAIATEAFATNVVSHLEVVRIITRKGLFAKGLSIVGISSIASHIGSPGVSIYAATKAAMESANRCLSKELFTKGIRINSIIAGQVNTEAYKELMQSKDSQVDLVLDRQYMGLIEPRGVAAMCVFLLSEQSQYINGSSLPVDGGYLV